MWSSWVKEKGTTQVMYIAKLNDGPKRVKKTFSMTLLAVVEQETRFILSSIEALIRTKTIVGITNKVDILGDRQAVDAHVACCSALFTRY
jgi:hypothetical protein